MSGLDKGRARAAEGSFWCKIGVVAGAVACLPSENLASYSSRERGIESEVSPADPVSFDAEAEAAGPGAAGSMLPASAPEVAGSSGVPSGCEGTCISPVLVESDAGASVVAEASDSDAGSPDTGGPLAAPAPDGGTDGGGTAPPCGGGALQGPDDRCFVLASALLSWADARAACRSRGAGWDLAAIHDAERNAWLTSMLGGITDAWVGASDSASEGSWQWVAGGEPFWSGNGTSGASVGGAYENWNDGTNPEPNGGAASDCARLRAGGGWADIQCAAQYASLCEGPPL